MTRDGASFPADADAFIGAFTGVTLAEADGEIVGYASWNRGAGYDSSAAVEIADLVALTRDATLALWRLFASFATVTGHVRLLTSGRDSARLVLPFAAGRWWTAIPTCSASTTSPAPSPACPPSGRSTSPSPATCSGRPTATGR